MIDLSLMLDKRKSYRTFNQKKKLEIQELQSLITIFLSNFENPTLDGSIPSLEIVEANKTSCPRGDLCICAYGSKDNKGLISIGYFLEHLDLYLEYNGIGVCWYGFGRTKIKVKDNQEFIIMLNVGYQKDNSLRKSSIEFKRNDISAFWFGDFDLKVKEDVRLAPSACNSQQWKIEVENNTLIIKRGDGNKSILIGKYKKYFNMIDMGIFLCFLELSLKGNGYNFKRNIIADDSIIARYDIV